VIATLICRCAALWSLGLWAGLLLLVSAAAHAQAALPVPENMHSPLALPLLPHFDRAAEATGLDSALLEALAGVESNFNARVVSRLGAVGLMQIMPRTAATMGLKGNRQTVRRQLQDPQTNVLTAARHLRQLVGQFAGDLEIALAAYNSGVGNVLKAGGRIPPNRETPAFVQRVMARYAQLRPRMQVSPEVPAAVLEADPTAAATESAAQTVPPATPAAGVSASP